MMEPAAGPKVCNRGGGQRPPGPRVHLTPETHRLELLVDGILHDDILLREPPERVGVEGKLAKGRVGRRSLLAFHANLGRDNLSVVESQGNDDCSRMRQYGSSQGRTATRKCKKRGGGGCGGAHCATDRRRLRRMADA